MTVVVHVKSNRHQDKHSQKCDLSHNYYYFAAKIVNYLNSSKFLSSERNEIHGFRLLSREKIRPMGKGFAIYFKHHTKNGSRDDFRLLVCSMMLFCNCHLSFVIAFWGNYPAEIAVVHPFDILTANPLAEHVSDLLLVRFLTTFGIYAHHFVEGDESLLVDHYFV